MITTAFYLGPTPADMIINQIKDALKDSGRARIAYATLYNTYYDDYMTRLCQDADTRTKNIKKLAKLYNDKEYERKIINRLIASDIYGIIFDEIEKLHCILQVINNDLVVIKLSNE